MNLRSFRAHNLSRGSTDQPGEFGPAEEVFKVQNYIETYKFSARIMQQPVKITENPRYEMASFGETPRFGKKDIHTDSKATGRANQKRAKSTATDNGGKKDMEKIVEIHQLDMNYDGGVYEVIANHGKELPQGRKLPSRGGHPDAMYEALNTITQATQQQMDLFRRMMYLMTVLMFIVFLTAATSLTLTIMMVMSGNTSNLNKPTSPPGKACKVHLH